MPTEAVLGVASKLGTAVSNPSSPPTDPTEMFEFLNEDVKLTVHRQNFSGIRGTRSLPGYREAVTTRSVAGSIRMQPTPTELAYWLPRVLGGTPSGSSPVTYPLAETLPSFDVFKLVGPAGGSGSYRFNYRNCVAAKGMFSASQGAALSFALEVVGKDRDDPPTVAGTWPSAVTEDGVGVPWMFYQAVLQFTPPGSGQTAVAYSFKEFTLTIDNELDQTRFLNSVTPTEFPTFSRKVSLSLNRPWGNSEAILALLRTGQIVGSLVFTNGTSVLTFSMPYLLAPALADPGVKGREEVQWPLQLVARSDWNATATPPAKIDELSVTMHA
jgi:hypothetical protein